MRCNVGKGERYVRLTVGIVVGLVAIFFYMAPWVRVLLGIVAVAGIVTGITRYCPINQMLKLDNCPER